LQKLLQRYFKKVAELFGFVTKSNVSLMYQNGNKMTTQQNFDSLTRAMNRKEQEITSMTQYILKVGEEGAGKQYMAQYEREQELWEQMRTQRDELKYQLFKQAA
jgi:hypothetical protein